jgi:hypothetical protein
VDYTNTDQYGLPPQLLFCLCGADIIGKTEGFSWIKECLVQEFYFDSVLVKKVLQFKLPAAQPLRILRRGAELFPASRFRSALPHSATNKITERSRSTTNQPPTQELIEGGNLSASAIRLPPICSTIPELNASLDSVTDTLNYN